MADYYVYSGAAGSNNGSSWANAFTTLKAAMESPRVAGDRFFVAHDHAETNTSALLITSPGTATNPQIVLCVNRAGSVPPVSADLQNKAGSVARTSTGSIQLEGCFYMEGMIIDAANGINIGQNGPSLHIFKNCWLKHGTTSGNLIFGPTSSAPVGELVRLINSDIDFGNASAGIIVRGGFRFEWFGGVLTGTGPNNLFGNGGNTINPGSADVRNVDLSAIGASKYLVNAANAAASLGDYRFERCRLSASLGGVMTNSIGDEGATRIDLVCCDSGANNYREEHYRYGGSVVQETTIVHSGGASDGTTSKSHKMVSSSGCSKYFPLQGPDIIMWLDSTGSKTFTLELVTDNVTLKDSEFGLELEYLGNASYPLGTLTTTRADVLSTGSNLTSSSETWTTTGLATPTKQKVSKTVTVNLKGFYRIRPVLAKASTTVYVDPLCVVT